MRKVALLTLMLLASVSMARAQVVAPPLPIGSDKVRSEPGANPKERDRAARAHKHKQGFHRDHMHDDSADHADHKPGKQGKPAEPAKKPNGTGPGKK